MSTFLLFNELWVLNHGINNLNHLIIILQNGQVYTNSKPIQLCVKVQKNTLFPTSFNEQLIEDMYYTDSINNLINAMTLNISKVKIEVLTF